MAKYSDFKSYIGANYGDYLKQEILHYIEKNRECKMKCVSYR